MERVRGLTSELARNRTGDLSSRSPVPEPLAIRAVLIDCGSRRIRALRTILAELGLRVESILLANANDSLDTILRAEAIVISGGPRLFTREPRLIDQFAFLDRVTSPTLGICLGHQAIGLRHGARISLGPARRGMETIRIGTPHPLFAGLGNTAQFTTDHCEGIDLPPGFAMLASSTDYVLEAMAHTSRPLFGVQFHPETSDSAGRQLLANFVARIRESSPNRQV